MNNYDLTEKIKEAYQTTTINNNVFEKFINSINWTKIYKADGEINYYLKNKLTLSIENINPFKEAWSPSILYEDGSIIIFDEKLSPEYISKKFYKNIFN